MDDTTPTSDAAPENEAVAVVYEDFKTGLPLGRYRLIVNPDKAYRYIRHRLFINGVSVPMMGIGIGLVLWGYTVIGLTIGIIGLLLRKVVKSQAPRILLHLAQNDAKIYYESIEYEIMEVRLARD
ncbi:MAG: hypothetical protein K2X64_10250 [Rhodocyclaceae bacterium]|nr:hypothetical protein [Rhodocyclaceae bacterium]